MQKKKKQSSQSSYLVRGTSTLQPLENRQVIKSVSLTDGLPDVSTDGLPARTLPKTAFIKPFFMPTKHYTTPTIRRHTKDWYIEFSFLNPFNGITWDRVRIRGLINKKQFEPYREQMAQKMRADIEIQLLQGALPSIYKDVVSSGILDHPDQLPLPVPVPVAAPDGSPGVTLATVPAGAGMNLITSLEKIAHSEGLGKSQDTKDAYKLYIARLKKYLASIGAMTDDGTKQTQRNKTAKCLMSLSDFTTEHAQEFKDFLMEDLELANATVNCTMVPIKGFFERYVAIKKIRENPFYFVKYLPKPKGGKYIPIDDNEKSVIREYLKKHHPELYLFTSLIYSCYVRPKEICGLLPSDFDLKKRTVMIRFNDSKTGNTSHRQLMGNMTDEFAASGLLDGGKTVPIFHKIMGEGDTLRKCRRRVTKLWDEIVKQKLLIDKDMYALKHTGNIDYLQSLKNVNEQHLTWLQNQNNHASLATTQHYITALRVPKMDHAKTFFGTY